MVLEISSPVRNTNPTWMEAQGNKKRPKVNGNAYNTLHWKFWPGQQTIKKESIKIKKEDVILFLFISNMMM